LLILPKVKLITPLQKKFLTPFLALYDWEEGWQDVTDPSQIYKGEKPDAKD
jgi:hypothetical protein